MCAKYHTNKKGYIISFIFHDKLDGHTQIIVISDFFLKMLCCAWTFKMVFKDFQMFKFKKK